LKGTASSADIHSETQMTINDRIRILIVHGDPIAHAGIAAGIARYGDLSVVEPTGSSPPGATAIGLIRQCSADVVVASHELGADLAAQSRRQSVSTTPVVIVGGIDREWAIRGAIESGVRGYLLSGCPFDELVACVRAVHRGTRYLTPQAAIRLADSVSVESLTPREEEVLSLVAEGLCNKAIARRMDIAVGTVKSHLKSAFEKLQVGSRTQAIAAVERRGLLSEAGGGLLRGRSVAAVPHARLAY